MPFAKTISKKNSIEEAKRSIYDDNAPSLLTIDIYNKYTVHCKKDGQSQGKYISRKQLEELIGLGASIEEICVHFGITNNQLQYISNKLYGTNIEDYLTKNAALLSRLELRRKLNISKSPAILIWLAEKYRLYEDISDKKDNILEDLKRLIEKQ